ncbi:BatD family protein [Marinomonas transparens]|uniref:BatD family protein n=1 Tax=Marinomonas transparens TaxID=2795388 RepID=UPI001F3BDDB8|nr:BatD family protein [Marinomonas transparens]
MLFILMLALLFTLLPTSVYADTVSASLDKTTTTENEVVQLTLRADFTNTGDGPDLSSLQRDFEVLGKSQTSQFSFNLGTNKALSYWVVSLMPKSVGTFEIPPIKIGDHQSQPLKLIVKNSPQLLDANGNPPVIVKISVSELNPYLQQEVVLSVKLYTSVTLQNANRSVPTHPDLVIERLTDDQMDYQTVNGTQYQVLIRDYLVFPQRSGELSIPPQTLQAMINTSTGRRMIKVQSEAINLQVLPIPASYPTDTWLPSKQVSISTALTKTSDKPRVGDTLIWTINIDAKGALPEQIPPLDFNSTRSYKLYPKPAQFSSQKTINGVTGKQVISVEVVPTDKGVISLPDVSITYWNTNKRAVHTVSAKTKGLDIAPLPMGSKLSNETTENKKLSEPLPPQTRSVAPISLAKKQLEDTNNVDTPKSIDVALSHKNSGFSWRDYTIFGLLIVSAAMLASWTFIWFKRKQQTPTEEAVPTLQEFAPLSSSDEKSAYRNLIACCRNSDLTQLRSHLLEWARHRWGDSEIRTIDDIKRLSSSVLITQLLMEAELMMYSNNTSHQWQGDALADALEEYSTGEAKQTQESQLKSLYPNF